MIRVVAPGVAEQRVERYTAVHDERSLLIQARALDEDALATIHETYYGPLFRYLLYRVGDHQAAEDLTSEVFVRFLSAIRDRTAPQNTLRGWLYGVASHLASDYHRRRYRATQVSLDERLASQQPGPLERVASTLRWREVQGAMEELTETQREVLALRFGQALPVRDVAQSMHKSEGAVKQLQVRALAALAEKLGRREA
jgi:RNA polymerase sigma-70 factor, ECF subfamily